jgi:hypothetical protein
MSCRAGGHAGHLHVHLHHRRGAPRRAGVSAAQGHAGPGRGRQPGLRVPVSARTRVLLGAAVATKWTGLVIPRTRFLFYMLPVVPFMALGLVAVLRSLPDPSSRRLGAVVGVAAVLAAVAYVPVWLYLPVPVGWVRLLPLVPSF